MKILVIGCLALAATIGFGTAQTNTHRYFNELYSGVAATQTLVYAVAVGGVSQITNDLLFVAVANRSVTGIVSVVTNTANSFTFTSTFSGTARNTYESALTVGHADLRVSPYNGLLLCSTADTYVAIAEAMSSIQGAAWYPPLPGPPLPSIGSASTQECACAHLGMREPIVVNEAEIPRVYEKVYITTLIDRTVTNGLRVDTLAYSLEADNAVYVATNGVVASQETNAVLRFIQHFRIDGTLVIDGYGILKDRDETCVTDFRFADRPSLSDAWSSDTGTSWKTRFQATLMP